jgi:hypothetical protein
MFNFMEDISKTPSPTFDVPQVLQCENVDNVHTFFKNLFIEDGIMDILLCKMVPM